MDGDLLGRCRLTAHRALLLPWWPMLSVLASSEADVRLCGTSLGQSDGNGNAAQHSGSVRR